MSKKPKPAPEVTDAADVDIKAIARLWKGGEHHKAAVLAKRAGAVAALVQEIPDDAALIGEAVNNVSHEEVSNG